MYQRIERLESLHLIFRKDISVRKKEIYPTVLGFMYIVREEWSDLGPQEVKTLAYKNRSILPRIVSYLAEEDAWNGLFMIIRVWQSSIKIIEEWEFYEYVRQEYGTAPSSQTFELQSFSPDKLSEQEVLFWIIRHSLDDVFRRVSEPSSKEKDYLKATLYLIEQLKKETEEYLKSRLGFLDKEKMNVQHISEKLRL